MLHYGKGGAAMDIFTELGIDRDDQGTLDAIAMHTGMRRAVRTLVSIRTHKGMTQEDVANELGVSRQAVARIENPSANPKISTLIAYALAIGARVDITVTDSHASEGIIHRTVSTSAPR